MSPELGSIVVGRLSVMPGLVGIVERVDGGPKRLGNLAVFVLDIEQGHIVTCLRRLPVSCDSSHQRNAPGIFDRWRADRGWWTPPSIPLRRGLPRRQRPRRAAPARAHLDRRTGRSGCAE